METITIFGLLLGLTAVFGGALIEGLSLGAILQLTAAIIVFGGTAAATFVSFPQQDISRAFTKIKLIFSKVDTDVRETIEEIIIVANVVRKEGILGIEPVRQNIKNDLLKRTLKYLVDGFDPHTVHEIVTAEIERELEEEEAAARVWESAGGYAPTIGIIGAVLGLIHVLANLKDPNSDLGSGIAVAFVATIYGVASANLILLPFGSKIKRKAFMNAMTKEVVLIGVQAIQEGANPLFLRERLNVFLEQKIEAQPSLLK
jgi:chemotaxis protein MotA